MLDPFQVELSAYLDASARYDDAVFELNALVNQNRHDEFEAASQKVRELALETEKTRVAMQAARANPDAGMSKG